MISCKFSHLFGINTSLHYKGIHKQTLSKNLFQLYASFIYFYSKTINYNLEGRCFGLWFMDVVVARHREEKETAKRSNDFKV